MENPGQQAVRSACLWLPEATETLAHGSATFKVRGKVFAYFLVNHHGDGRVALWIHAASGLQQSYVEADPRRFFVPPYVGHRGWVGVDLEKGLPWTRIATLVREAYEYVAPPALTRTVGNTPPLAAPPRALSAAERDPFKAPRGKKFLTALRAICLKLPEAHEAVQFGSPVWQAGRKTFAWARCADGQLTACFWVGVDQQPLLIADTRYRIPAYMGHNGWISLDVSAGYDLAELTSLALESYRHFALKRMLQLIE